MAASFNMSLIRAFATQISDEVRAFSNQGFAGLSIFTPNINIFRDPRWGRGTETQGEDPVLSSQYVYNLIQGLQVGEDPRYLKTLPCCKHFSAYDLENWKGVDRFHFDAEVTQQDITETYNAPFETCARDANVASVMCSYNCNPQHTRQQQMQRALIS
jgi:beta-D-xylosidase 4